MDKYTRNDLTLAWLLNLQILTPKLLAQLIFKTTEPTVSQEKNIYNVLRKLEKKNLVESTKMKDCKQKEFNNQSAYALTNKGAEEALNKFDVIPGVKNLLTIKNHFNFSDLPVHFLTMPRGQREHKLLINKVHIAVYLSPNADSTNTIHSTKTYSDGNKLRPDAIIYQEHEIFVEVDRLTETTANLLDKFKNYRDYLDNSKNEKLRTILFVVPDVPLRSQFMRFKTILNAFLDVFKQYGGISLVMIKVSEIDEFLRFEGIKKDIKKHINWLVSCSSEKTKLNYLKYSTTSVEKDTLDRIVLHAENNINRNVIYKILHSFDSDYIFSLDELQTIAVSDLNFRGLGTAEGIQELEKNNDLLIIFNKNDYHEYYSDDYFKNKSHVYKHINIDYRVAK